MPLMPIALLSTLLHAYIGLRLVPALLAWPWAAAAVALVLLAGSVLMPTALITHRLWRQPWADRMAWAAMLSLGLFSSLLVLTLARDALALLGLIANALFDAGLPLAAWAPASAAATFVGALALTLLGLWNARRTAAVVDVEVPIAGLPPTLHGFTIAQISDVHIGPTIKAPYLQAIVDRVNRLQADLVAVTGDLVDGSVRDLAAHVAPLAGLCSRHGSFFVTGNHEYYSGAQAWIEELQRLGLQVLMNRHVVVRHGEASLVLAGVADYHAHHFDAAHRSDAHAAIAGAPADAALRVLLAHQPRSANEALRAGFDLQLSGHTHGGQFLPWNLFVPLQQPFTAGLHRLGTLWIYVSRGTGYWGPPKRLGAPSEITRLRLVRTD